MKYETNIFRIENLQALTADYFLYEILGLNSHSDDFDINIQHIIKSLSYTLKHPVTSITREERPCLVIKADREIVSQMPNEYSVKGNDVVYFKKIDETFTLDFMNYTDETKPIILRFLQFDIQTELNNNSRLWQPGSGDAFFSQQSFAGNDYVAINNGFFVRAVELPGGGFGFSVDLTKKYISKYPLDVHLSRSDFKSQKISSSHLLYQYGNKRYEIRAEQYFDLNASQTKFVSPTTGQTVTLLQDTQQRFGKSMPPEVANLPDTAAVILYRTNRNEERKVIAGMCFKVYDTEDPMVKQLHRKSIINPFERRRNIRIVRNNYLSRLRFGNVNLKISEEPIHIKKVKFLAPDLKFGNDIVLSARNSEGAVHTTMENLGRNRKSLLFDPNVGFYTNAPFQPQYFVVPQTVYNMYANEQYFLKDLITEVNNLHPTETGWEPEVIVYDNRNKKTSLEVGLEIITRINNASVRRGSYAVVMLPSNIARIKRQHDELAALVVSESQTEHNMTISIMHSDTIEDAYQFTKNGAESYYKIKHDKRGKYSGYVKGVAINQILLNNERWPFVLETPLNADLTIGIDVKKQTAGFTFIDKYSNNILTRSDKSQNKEKLSTGQIVNVMVENIKSITAHLNYSIRKIVIHRDGRLFRSEKEGILKAVEMLKKLTLIPSDATVSIVEIPKHSITPFRLFEVLRNYDIYKESRDNGKVLNPEIGSYTILNNKEAFLCTTGREFRHGGSSNPLYIKYESGGMKLEDILEDIYFLSCLAYTKPDDCSRFPLTIKITDRKINNQGSTFDTDSFNMLKSETLN